MVQKVLMKLTGGDRSDVFGSRGVVSAFLTFGSRWWWLFRSRSQPFANKELARRCGGPRSCV